MFIKARIFSGNANRPLAEKICQHLGVGVDLGRAKVGTFSDGETQLEIIDDIRGKKVFLIQPTCHPANHNIMELLIMIDAAKRASAQEIIAVIPYYGYARQDRKVAPRAPISAKLVANLITAAGAHRVMCLELHAGQIQGFFDIPVDNLFLTPVYIPIIKRLKEDRELVIVSPDSGGVERAKAYAKHLDVQIAIIDKRRERANESEVFNIIGDVEGKDAVIVDDLVDTGGTLTKGAKAVKDRGASRVFAAIAHPVLSGNAIQKLEDSVIEKLIVADTIPLSDNAKSCRRILTVSVAELFAKAIRNVNLGESVSSLFEVKNGA